MVINRKRTILLMCLALFILLLLAPMVVAMIPPPPVNPYASGLCQMEYVDRTVGGQPAWEVTAITMGPDGGRLGEMQFQPGDLIVKVGNKNVEPGEKLDEMIRTAILEKQRTITLRDPWSGAETICAF